MTQTFADQALTLDLIGDYAILTLNQPAKRNAMTKAMWSALPAACAAVPSWSAIPAAACSTCHTPATTLPHVLRVGLPLRLS